MMNDMNKLIEIYKLIDWNASAEDNKVGIDMAIKIDNLQFFIQPFTEQFNKNIWENCAVILSNKSDSDISPYLKELLFWLQDMNWPGAQRIYDRFLHYENDSLFYQVYEECEKMAANTTDEIWLENLFSLKRARQGITKT